jgi:predicted dehydrogenase
MKPVRWGVLGAANFAKQFMAPAIHMARGAEFAGLATSDQAKAAGFQAFAPGITVYPTYEAMLADPGIEAVYIPLPNHLHIEWTLKAIAAGKHVLVEKPMALKASEIDDVIAAQRGTDLLVSEAFMVTYHPQWQKVRDLIADGAIGTLRHVQGAFTYFLKDPNNMRNILELGGGALPDIGVYPTVTTRFATGKEPQRVSARVDFDPVFKTDIFSSIRADFGDFELSFYLSTQMANRQLMVFHGEKGFIEVLCPFNAGLYAHDDVVLHSQNHGHAETFRFSGVNQYRLEVEAFARVAGGAKEHYFTLESSRKNQNLIDAIFAAGKSGNWEKVG